MSSLKLTQSLKQQMVLTPQLRQRIEMLQMTSLELTDLIQQEMIANPILEEVTNDEEVQEISENILDQNSDGYDEVETYQNGFEENGADIAASHSLSEYENFVPEQPAASEN